MFIVTEMTTGETEIERCEPELTETVSQRNCYARAPMLAMQIVAETSHQSSFPPSLRTTNIDCFLEQMYSFQEE